MVRHARNCPQSACLNGEHSVESERGCGSRYLSAQLSPKLCTGPVESRKTALRRRPVCRRGCISRGKRNPIPPTARPRFEFGSLAREAIRIRLEFPDGFVRCLDCREDGDRLLWVPAAQGVAVCSVGGSNAAALAELLLGESATRRRGGGRTCLRAAYSAGPKGVRIDKPVTLAGGGNGIPRQPKRASACPHLGERVPRS